MQNPIAFFLEESERIPWIRRVAPLNPDYTRLAGEFRSFSNQMHVDRGLLLQESRTATEKRAMTDVFRRADLVEGHVVNIGSLQPQHDAQVNARFTSPLGLGSE